MKCIRSDCEREGVERILDENVEANRIVRAVLCDEHERSRLRWDALVTRYMDVEAVKARREGKS